MKFIIFFGLVLFLVTSKVIRIEVGPQKKPCEGVAPTTCLQVKFPNSNTFQNFYSQIQGWNFTEGQSAVLDVNAVNIPNPPADAPSIRYTLVRVVSTTPSATNSTRPRPNRIQGTWYLKLVGNTPIVNQTQFNITSDQIGFTYCNVQSYPYKLYGQSNIKIQPGFTTLMYCQDIFPSEQTVSSALRSSNNYLVSGNILVFLNNNRRTLVLTK